MDLKEVINIHWTDKEENSMHVFVLRLYFFYKDVLVFDCRVVYFYSFKYLRTQYFYTSIISCVYSLRS